MAKAVINLQKESGGITKISSADGVGVTELVVPESGTLATLESPTFTGSVVVPTPTIGAQAVNKNYADLKVALSSFIGTNQSLLGIGYQKLPGGLILQWGNTVNTTDANGNFQIVYPITFPTSQLTCIFSLGDKIAAQFQSSLTLSNNINVFGKSSMNINVTNSQNINAASVTIRINWLVIGY